MSFQWTRFGDLFGPYPVGMPSMMRVLEVANLAFGIACAFGAAIVGWRSKPVRLRAVRTFV